MRQIVLDTETTGLELSDGHRIIEIGAIELLDRRPTPNEFCRYVNPDREIDAGATAVHGITAAQLAEAPRFADIVDEFLAFIDGAELLIHNAPFDVAFLNAEIQRVIDGGRRLSITALDQCCQVVDTLKLARTLHPGQKNSLDALCRRYAVDNSHRAQHGARIDAEILVKVYLAMTGGQTTLFADTVNGFEPQVPPAPAWEVGEPLVLRATAVELAAHEAWLEAADKHSGGRCLWTLLAPTDPKSHP
ncbi:MAG: DNA polymerase III subunit epsilon [Acidiferrobacter sp.]